MGGGRGGEDASDAMSCGALNTSSERPRELYRTPHLDGQVSCARGHVRVLRQHGRADSAEYRRIVGELPILGRRVAGVFPRANGSMRRSYASRQVDRVPVDLATGCIASLQLDVCLQVLHSTIRIPQHIEIWASHSEPCVLRRAYLAVRRHRIQEFDTTISTRRSTTT